LKLKHDGTQDYKFKLEVPQELQKNYSFLFYQPNVRMMCNRLEVLRHPKFFLIDLGIFKHYP